MFEIDSVCDSGRLDLVNVDNIVHCDSIVVAIGSPHDCICNSFDIGYVSSPPFDQIPRFHAPIFSNCEG